MVLCIYLIQERTNGLPYRLAANIANPEYRRKNGESRETPSMYDSVFSYLTNLNFTLQMLIFL